MLRENISVFFQKASMQLPKSGGVYGLVFLIGWARGLSLVGFVVLHGGMWKCWSTWYYIGEIVVGLRRLSDVFSNGERCNFDLSLDAPIAGEAEDLGARSSSDRT